MKNQFNAYVVRKEEQGGVNASIEQLKKEDLPNGDVMVKVQYSSVNYKDGLATLEKGGVVREYPMVPGIDLAGTVEESVSGRFAPGDRVISTGFEPGVSHYGGTASMLVCAVNGWCLCHRALVRKKPWRLEPQDLRLHFR